MVGADVLVTIRCITYNHEPFIRQCLEGFVMQQTNFKFEAIVHDDASTDGTAAIIREYAEKYPEIIKPIYETENQYSKHDGSLRRIMDAAMSPSSKYIALCEGDDYWTDPQKLQKQVDFLESHPDYSMCYTRAGLFSQKQGKMIGENRSYSQSQQALPEDVIWRGGDFITTCSIMLRKEILQTYPEYCRKCHVGDYPLQIYSAMIGKVFYIDESMCVWRVENSASWSGQFTHDLTEKNILNFQSEIDMLNAFADHYPQYKIVLKNKIVKYLNWHCYLLPKKERKKYKEVFRKEFVQYSWFWKMNFWMGQFKQDSFLWKIYWFTILKWHSYKS